MSSPLKPTLGAQLEFGHPLARGLVSLLLMNEGSGDTVQDLSNNNNIGTLGDGAVFRAGKHGTATWYDGSSFCKIDNSPSIDMTTDLSFVVAIRFLSYPNSINGIIAKRTAFVGLDWQFWYDNDVNFLKFYDGTDTRLDNLTENPSLDTDYVYVVTITGGVISLYRNGVLVGTDSVNITSTGDDIYIGALGGDAISPFGIHGLISYVYLYNRALSASEIQQLYINPFLMFDRDPIELWVGSVGAGAPPTGIPILRRRRESA